MFGVTRQSYYKHVKQEEKRLLEADLVLELIDEIRRELPRVGGKKLYHMIKPQLTQHGIKLGRDKFFDLLRGSNRLIKLKRSGIRTTYSYRRFNRYDNLFKEYTPEAPNRAWVSDITYVRVTRGFVYLSLITDAYSRKIVGYHLSRTLSTDGCVKALNMALRGCNNPEGIIHHSDRGTQYCSKQYTSILEDNKMQISMTQPDSPLDNSIAERINGIIKQEFIDCYYLSGVRDTRKVLKRAVSLYNAKRPHMSLNLATPNEVHDKDCKPISGINYSCKPIAGI